MKYAVLVGDGMGDYPIAALGDKTPLAAAETPYMDSVADHGDMGLVRTLPAGCETGSDTANLSLLGYDPRVAGCRRGPLEAASLGVALDPEDVAFRCNLVTFGEHPDGPVMEDYSAGHIGSDEARGLIEAIEDRLGDSTVRFYPGISYRHLMVWKGGRDAIDTTPPHDIIGQPVGPYLDRVASSGGERLLELMSAAETILRDHPVNAARKEQGKRPGDHIWLWGQGRAPHLDPFTQKTGLAGAMISAVDLLRGIGVYTGFQVIRVPGATGYLDTDYDAKARYALWALEDVDLVYVHVEAPDEAGHAGLVEEKIAAIEAFDRRVVGKVLEGLKTFSQYRIMVVMDHLTPISVRTHTTEPVPFAMAGAGISPPPDGYAPGYSEAAARSRAVFLEEGHRLMARFLGPG